MRFVDDDQIEMADAEAGGAAVGHVDESHHGGVGADIDAALGVVFGDQIHRAGIRQVRLEGIARLVDQSDAVGEEKHTLASSSLRGMTAALVTG